MTICCTQVDQLLDKHLVEEAIILAETIAAVESSKHSSKAEQVCVTLLLLHHHVLSQPLLPPVHQLCQGEGRHDHVLCWQVLTG